MNKHNFAFRSKSDREKESKLLSNYREIGIAAIAAASHACRKDKTEKAAQTRTVANHNYRD